MFRMIEEATDGNPNFDAAFVFPDQSPEARLHTVKEAHKWLAAQPVAKCVLVSVRCS